MDVAVVKFREVRIFVAGSVTVYMCYMCDGAEKARVGYV